MYMVVGIVIIILILIVLYLWYINKKRREMHEIQREFFLEAIKCLSSKK